jgi:hypothetical protein
MDLYILILIKKHFLEGGGGGEKCFICMSITAFEMKQKYLVWVGG